MKFGAPVLLVGNGPVTPAQVAAGRAVTGPVVAADGGVNTVARFGLPLALAIGDSDSISPENMARHRVRYRHDPDQNTTDFEKCLQTITAPLIVGIGFLGGRLDHELAAMNALARFARQKLVLLGEQDIVFVCPARLVLALPTGTRLSVFPMGAVSRLRSTGLLYPLDGLDMAPAARIGTSNLTNANEQVIEVAQGSLLVILPARFLPAVVATL